MPFGDELRRLRTEKGLTQKQLAEAAGVGTHFIVKLESGERSRLGADVLYRICDALGVTSEHFRSHVLTAEEEKPAPKKGKKK